MTNYCASRLPENMKCSGCGNTDLFMLRYNEKKDALLCDDCIYKLSYEDKIKEINRNINNEDNKK